MTSKPHATWDIGSVPLIAPEVLTGIVASVADFAIVIDRAGQVLSLLANPFHGAMADLKTWANSDLRGTLAAESIPKFDQALAQVGQSPASTRATELNHIDPATRAEFPVSYSFHQIGKDDAILMLGRDLRLIADMQQQLVNAQVLVERDYERQRGFDTRFRVLMHATRDPIVFVNVSSGKLDEVNGAAASFFGRTAEELRGTDFADLFEGQTPGELNAELAAAALSDGGNSLSLSLRRGRRRAQVHPSFFRAGGARMVLCRIASPDGAAEAGSDDIARLDALFERGPDAIVFTRADGVILSANESFLSMTESGHDDDVRGKPISKFLERGSVEQRVLLDNATRSGRIKNYPTRIRGSYETGVAVDVSATHLSASEPPVYAFVLRDAGPTAPLRMKNDAQSVEKENKKDSVIELVGSTSLKDIVADTTDVIEKMCIETALHLTGDNRAAAAEMLGLSRQSFYVKLRKFGLGSKSDD